MTDRIKSILAIVAAGTLFNAIALWLKSDVVSRYLCENIVIILITLLAINIATISVIMTKLKEIVDKFGGDFEATISEMRISVREQLILIVVAFFALMLRGSAVVQAAVEYHAFILDSVIMSVLIYALDILRDTGNSIFHILDFDQKAKDPGQ
jgi:hypothetical protein